MENSATSINTKRIERHCEVCNSIFFVVPSVVKKGRGRFCSRSCYGQWLSENIRGANHPNWKGGNLERSCLICGRSFEVGPAVVKKDGGKYCSWDCSYEALRRFRKYSNDADNSAKVKCICVICNKEFYRNRSAVERGEGRTCSRKCMGKWRSRHCTGENGANWQGGCTITIECEQCGEIFQTTKSRQRNGRGRFCSRDCFHEWYSLNKRGENNHLWRGGNIQQYPGDWREALRESIRERDGYECNMCSAPETKQRHCIHHIDYDRDNLEPDNLLTLCRSCHTKTNFNRHFWQDNLAEFMATM